MGARPPRLRLLLLSNSTKPGQAPLAHAMGAIDAFLGQIRELVFVPFAAVRMSAVGYTEFIQKTLRPLAIRVRPLPEGRNGVDVLRMAPAVAVGGGNTFHLLHRLSAAGLLRALRARVRAGVPYLAWSAGSNLACPTIRTTNDMPIVEPASFGGLGLVPFQINPHYTDQAIPNHGGESRDDRIAEFVALHPTVRVIGLREGTWLRLEEDRLTLHGPAPMRVFEAGRPPRDCSADEELGFLLR